MTSSFSANIEGGPFFQWDEENGFSGEDAAALNEELVHAPGQTCTPPAILARDTLLKFWPGAVISDFKSAPLGAVPDKAVS
jgi:hypothetical protein